VVVEAGRHEVVFRYRPWWFVWGTVTGMAALLVTIFLLVRYRDGTPSERTGSA